MRFLISFSRAETNQIQHEQICPPVWGSEEVEEVRDLPAGHLVGSLRDLEVLLREELLEQLVAEGLLQ
jgi:hypothetical protein